MADVYPKCAILRNELTFSESILTSYLYLWLRSLVYEGNEKSVLTIWKVRSSNQSLQLKFRFILSGKIKSHLCSISNNFSARFWHFLDVYLHTWIVTDNPKEAKITTNRFMKKVHSISRCANNVHKTQSEYSVKCEQISWVFLRNMQEYFHASAAC